MIIIIFDRSIIFMDLPKFHRVNGTFYFTSKIRIQKDFQKILDIQIYKQMLCTKHSVILKRSIFM